MDLQETQSQQQFISALLHSLMQAHDTPKHTYEHKTLIYRAVDGSDRSRFTLMSYQVFIMALS
jgi:hypothetical protein